VRDFALEVIQAPYFIAGNSIGKRHTQMQSENDSMNRLPCRCLSMKGDIASLSDG
jgi:hypothetical protein